MAEAFPEDGGGGRPHPRWVVLTLVAVFGVVVAGSAFLVGRATDDEPTATTTTATSATTSTSTSTTGPVVDTLTAVWPAAGSGITYHDPRTAALGFAVDLVGFRDPVVGAYLAGDSRSGEVELRPTADGPVTTVFVRQLSGGDSWWVLGATTDGIQVTAPRALEVVSSPLELGGTSTAFEATVSVAVYQDGSGAPLGTGFVMGGSMGTMGPFTGEVPFERPTAAAGALVLTTDSMADGSVWSASVLRVWFTDPGWP